MARIEVDWDKCTGLGVCESLAPKYFEVDDEGTLVVRSGDVPDEDLEEVREGVAGCPTEALRLRD